MQKLIMGYFWFLKISYLYALYGIGNCGYIEPEKKYYKRSKQKND